MPIQLNESQEHIRDFVKSNCVAVLSTANKNCMPHGATIYYWTDDEMNFFFITKTDTEKSKNLSSNPFASLAISESDSQTTVQVVGRIEQETSKDKIQETYERILRISMESSQSGEPPINELSAGAYVTYRLIPDKIKMASFIRPDHGSPEKIFRDLLANISSA